MRFTDLVPRGLIVSCQALEDEPLHGPHIMAGMARAALMGGAIGIRANGPDDIRAIKAAVELPVVGLLKEPHSDSDVYITPTLAAARNVAQAGADVVAIDATARPRPGGETFEAILSGLKAEFKVLVLADVSTFEEGMDAVRAGADAVATTMAGYTEYTSQSAMPAFDLLERLVIHSPVPVVAEGGIIDAEQAARAMALGAYAAVVGGAITRPQLITARFVKAVNQQLGIELRNTKEIPPGSSERP